MISLVEINIFVVLMTTLMTIVMLAIHISKEKS